jgi:allantoinase
MNGDLVVAGGTIATGDDVFTGNVIIRDGVIAEIQRGESRPTTGPGVLDVTGRTVIPGAVDAHTHFEEPGPGTYREDYASGSRCCAAGGVTTTLEHPLSRPPVRDAETFKAKQAVAGEKSVIDFGLWGGLIPGYIDHMEEMASLGAVAFKVFMSGSGADYPMAEDGDLWVGMVEAARIGALVGIHAESEPLTVYFTKKLQRQGRTDGKAISEGRPPLAELEAINRAVFLAGQTGTRIHIVHTSIASGAELITEARQRGIDASCETCAHYLHLDWSALDRLGGYAKCKPPVRAPEEVERLWQAVLAGHVQFIASDHAPYTREEKEGSVWDAGWGIPGAQTMLPILISDGLIGRGWDLNSFVNFTSRNAAKRFGVYPQKGALQVGSDGDLTIIDLDGSWTISEEDLFSKHHFSPYVGETLRGRIEQTIVRGQVVYDRGEIVINSGHGQFVRPASSAAARGSRSGRPTADATP